MGRTHLRMVHIPESTSLGYDAQWPKHEQACEKAMRCKDALPLYHARSYLAAWRTSSDQHATAIAMVLRWAWRMEGGCDGDGTIFQETRDIGCKGRLPWRRKVR